MTFPLSTYRVQFRPEFGFEEAAGIASYLADLGVTHLYASPYLQAASGSTHGYDVVDHSKLNDELGGEAGHDAMSRALSNAGIGQVLDIVPNHVAIPGRQNKWWWDVLENGPASRYAPYFDIDWNPPEGKLRNIVLMPVLGDHYGRVLENGELRLSRSGSDISVHYYDNEFPVDLRSLTAVFAKVAGRQTGSDELRQVVHLLEETPSSTAPNAGDVDRRRSLLEQVKQLLRRSFETASVAAAVDDQLDAVNANFDELDTILSDQNYRLAFWRVATAELDYRRFFDINTLVGIRPERTDVFDEIHQLPLRLLSEGKVSGFRIDHIDGLRDPVGYLRQLRSAAGPDAYLVVEKILEAEERLPASWPVQGTTGYDAMARIGGLFVEPLGEEPVTRFYGEFTGQDSPWPEFVRAGKEQVVTSILSSDADRLTNAFTRLCERTRRYRDYSRSELRAALVAVLTAFPVYRTYAVSTTNSITRADEEFITAAIDLAAQRHPELDAELLAFLGRVLTLQLPDQLAEDFVMRFQQLSGPVMAKGVEDTAFYRYNRMITLNEVGGDPGRFAVRPDDFHEAAAEAQRLWPYTMQASTTHDTKRSEDVRHRIALLSEIPSEWAAAVRRWSAINEHHRRPIDSAVPEGDRYPDRNLEYLLYSTLVGAYPISADRTLEYVKKASKEAKVFTSWTEPNPAYDDALASFVSAIASNVEFQNELRAFVEPLIEPGYVNSLSAALIKLMAPGVPDIYQGSELWCLTLVDPDNRQPVDFEVRRQLLKDVRDSTPEQMLERMGEGLPKLHVTSAALRLRRRCPECFDERSSYEPLLTQGQKAVHVLAFLRGGAVACVVPRLVLGRGSDWSDTYLTLPEGRWRNILTGDENEGGKVLIEDLLRRFPVALLEAKQ